MKNGSFFLALVLLSSCRYPVKYTPGPPVLGKTGIFDIGVAVTVFDVGQGKSLKCLEDARFELDRFKVSRFLVEELKASGLFKSAYLAANPSQINPEDIVIRAVIERFGLADQGGGAAMDLEIEAALPSKQTVMLHGKIGVQTEGRQPGAAGLSEACSAVLKSMYRADKGVLNTLLSAINPVDASGQPVEEKKPEESLKKTLEQIQEELQKQ